ncbi:sugar phosphate isomerase/epimerase [Pseudomonas sp. F-14 TE3623]
MREYSLAYLTVHGCTPAEAIRVAAQAGYDWVGLRPWPVAPGAAAQDLLDNPLAMRATLDAIRETGVRIFDLEIIRIADHFDAKAWVPCLEAAAPLNARAVLVAGDDLDETRLTDNYAQLCEVMQPFGLTANLEFMPWTAVPDVATAKRILRNAGAPQNAGILVDALHFGRSSTSVQDIQCIPREWLHYAQMCDAPAGMNFTNQQLIQTARSERLLPGEGSIDLEGLVAALPVDLPISIEVVNLQRQAAQTPVDWAAQCLAACRAYSR